MDSFFGDCQLLLLAGNKCHHETGYISGQSHLACCVLLACKIQSQSQQSHFINYYFNILYVNYESLHG